MQVNFGAGPESDHSIHLTPHAHTHNHNHNHNHTHPHPHFEHAGQASSAFSSFRHPAAPAIDPGLDQTAVPSRNGHQPMASVHQPAQPHLLQPDNASLGSPHLAHPFYAEMTRASQTPSTPSNASPRFSNMSPAPPPPKQLPTSYVPTDRPAPSRHVDDDTLDDAYSAFVLYCNPSFATDTDTTELIRQFRTPPKSDGKAFSTWTLFGLIRKFDAKEIKTWTQLALDLGVEPPDTDKGQSTQKVQQYSVRLKRWMRAMHIDAFFEYMLGRQHSYYLQIPPPHDPFPEDGRDGVPLGEDLAIRALDPKFRPKRGRRKADEGDDDLDLADPTPPRKRPQLDTSIPFGNVLQPQSAYPTSAHPDNMDGFLQTNDPWAASGITSSSAMTPSSVPGRMNVNKNLTPYSASPMSGQQIRWRVNTQDNPTTPHPLSAVTPHSAHPDFFDEPQSAITPSSSSKPRARRRHGPAVSSAWPSNNASSTGKLRGRPPSNRSVRDGPFVTFPANPKMKEGPPIEMNRNTGSLTPIVERAQSDPPGEQQHHFRFPPTPASAISPTTIDAQLQNTSQRPHRLSLQVPKNVGNPVRLVTPTVLVNGEEDPTPSTAMASSTLSADSGRSSPAQQYLRNEQSSQYQHHQPIHPHPPVPSPQQPPPSSSSTLPPTQPTTLSPLQTQLQTAISHSSPSPATQPIPSLPPESLNRALVAEIIRAPLSGRRKRLRGNEAKNLAAAILHPILPPTATATATTANPLLAIALASCLGLASNVGLPLGSRGPTGGVRKIECVRFRVGGDGYESPMDEDDEDDTVVVVDDRRGGGGADADKGGSADGGNRIVRESFDVFFAVGFGATAGGGGGGLTGEWVARGLSALPPPRPRPAAREAGALLSDDDDDDDDDDNADDDDDDDDDDVDGDSVAAWKAKCLHLRRRLKEKKKEVNSVRDHLLDVALS